LSLRDERQEGGKKNGQRDKAHQRLSMTGDG
jgi:hypothetical protein